MNINVGSLDRIVRIIIGVALVLLGVFGVLQGAAAIVGYVIAAIALITGLASRCPLYAVCKINTHRKAAQ